MSGKTTRRSNLALCLFLFGVFNLRLTAQQPKVLAPHDPVLKELPLEARTRKPAVLRSMVGGLWMTDPNFKSSIYVSNILKIAPLTITPILYLSNGKALTLADVTLEPSGTAVISINDALNEKGLASWATLYGYVDLQYKWAWDAICATVHSVDTVHSVVFTSGLQFPDSNTTTPSADSTPHHFEGMWWKQEANVTGFVALSNLSSQPLHATLGVTDASENSLSQRSVTISPHGTKLVELKELQSASSLEGGIRIQHDGPDSALVVTGGLEDLSQGYSATIPFFHSPTLNNSQKATIAELGLMTGTADPMMQFPADTVFTPYSLIRNISEEPVTASLTVYWMEAATTHAFSLQPMTFAPHHTQNLDMATLLSQAGLKNYNGSFNLVFDVPRNSGSLLMLSGSVDRKNTYVFEVLPRSADKSIGKSMGYWSTANGDDTMVTLWNPADEPQDFLFTLFFSGGHYKLPLHLGPRTTRGFNVSEIIQNQIPDADGELIPATVHDGSAEVTGLLGAVQHILIALDAATYNVRKATCNWGCTTCNNVVDESVEAAPFTLAIGGATQLTGSMQLKDGVKFTGGTWSSSNTVIASVSGGLTTALSTGAVTITDTFGEYPLLSQVCGGPPPSSCPGQPIAAGGGGTITNNTPILTGIDPSDWPSGASTPSVSFMGQYFGTNAPTLTFSPSSGITYSLVSYNDTHIIANITVASGTPTEAVDVSVTNNGYGGVGFMSGGGSVSATSAPIYATVRAPLGSPEITVIAWVNGNAPDLNPLPTGENSTLQGNLQNGTTSQQAVCAGQVIAWTLSSRLNVNTSADVNYANAWLLKNSANTAPPSTITPSGQLSGGNYRLFNDFGGSGLPLGPQVGSTPDPCKTGIPAWVSAGQPSQYEGYSSTSPSGQVYQIAEGRIGSVGQAASETINGRTVPWIWSAIEFNSANGTPTYNPPLGMFPTYYLYVNGTLTYTFAQSTVAAFILKDQTYQLVPSQIP